MKKALNRTLLINLAFYLLIILNFVMVVMLLQNKSTNETGDIGFEDVCEILITAGKYQYLSENVTIDIGPQTDSLHLLCLNNNRLITLRIAETQCEMCILEAVADFKEFLKKNLSITGLILATYSNDIDFEAFKSLNKDMIILNIPHINLEVEKTNTPYIFPIDHFLRARMVFVHLKEFPDRTGHYLNALKDYPN